MSGDRTPREAFLAGEREGDVLFYLDESAVGDPDALAGVAEAVEGGVVLVVPGDRGRAGFERAVGLDPMAFARDAMEREGAIDRDCAGGACPDGPDHRPRFVFAFAEGENEAAGGIYAEGDVIHAYAACECGTTYSDRWVVEGAAGG